MRKSGPLRVVVPIPLTPAALPYRTMNTADRSIALVDSAMGRRFAFVELHPQKPPIAGLLRRGLAQQGIDSDAGDLLDALNARLSDADYAIGPSYLMRESIYAKSDGLGRVWRSGILLLLVEHDYTRDVDVEREYGLASLRASITQDAAQTGAAPWATNAAARSQNLWSRKASRTRAPSRRAALWWVRRFGTTARWPGIAVAASIAARISRVVRQVWWVRSQPVSGKKMLEANPATMVTASRARSRWAGW
jgi:hypothetical protein